MKKIIALLLSLILILGILSGCVTKKVKVVDEDDKKTTSRKDTDDEKEKEEEEEEETTPTKKEEEEQVTPPVQTGYVRGTSNTTGWKSEFLGLQFKASATMTMSTEEEMLAMMQLGQEYVNGSAQIDYTTLDNVYEMMAVDLNNSNVIVMAQKLPLANMTEQTIALGMKQNLESQTGLNYVVTDPFEFTFCGKDCVALDASASINGLTVSQSYIIMKVEDRVCAIAITSNTEGFLEQALACFSPC